MTRSTKSGLIAGISVALILVYALYSAKEHFAQIIFEDLTELKVTLEENGIYSNRKWNELRAIKSRTDLSPTHANEIYSLASEEAAKSSLPKENLYHWASGTDASRNRAVAVNSYENSMDLFSLPTIMLIVIFILVKVIGLATARVIGLFESHQKKIRRHN